jgi:hypothetical protein
LYASGASLHDPLDELHPVVTAALLAVSAAPITTSV